MVQVLSFQFDGHVSAKLSSFELVRDYEVRKSVDDDLKMEESSWACTIHV